MGRPQATARLNYYPLNDACIPLLVKHLALAGPSATILDPCAGEGRALAGIAERLGIAPSDVHGIELATSRAAALRALVPEGRVLAPADFKGTRISYNAFGLVYCNPPFAAEMGGGRREEMDFAVLSIYRAAVGGVCVFVFPESVVFSYGAQAEGMRRTLACRLDDVRVYKLPEKYREYREIVVLGTKRDRPLPAPGQGRLALDAWWLVRDEMEDLGTGGKVWRVPPGKRPKLWEKTSYTPDELRERVARSPLQELIRERPHGGDRRPPRPLGKGQVALILAAGELDGLVKPDGEEAPHVVRGTARKEKFRDDAKCETTVNDDGSTTDKEVFSERVILTVRAVGPDGTIRTFHNAETST